MTELEYASDSASRFQALLDLPWCVFLDSAGNTGRYDILAAAPWATLTTRGTVTEIVSHGQTVCSDQDPLRLLREQLGAVQEFERELPFYGGAIGYFGYDLGRRFERLPAVATADIDMPDMAIGLYDWAVVVDHHVRRCWLVGAGRDERTFDEWDSLLERLRSSTPTPTPTPTPPPPPPPPTPTPTQKRVPLGLVPRLSANSTSRSQPSTVTNEFEVLSDVRRSIDRDAYAKAFHAIKKHIRVGDCYQINLTQRFEADVRGHPWHAYRHLRRVNPAPFSAYLDLPDGTILSSSPERFLEVRDRAVETRPIKGTRARRADSSEDRAAADALRASTKDRAENVMIVDLLRNDLGKCCEPGSVTVNRLFDIETFATVHHLVSTVTGTLRRDQHALDLLRAAFPGGSITGAPKVRAMQIIETLEPYRRSVYCGAIGYVGYNGDMDLNIAIRTLVKQRDRIYAWAGGGIVADSSLEEEYQECLDKARALLEVLNPL